ncbi:hypothetical protein M2138_001203 [Dysgonomonadaceae bacterium PH5-43]|nr:hypothetical protein [Dysgonomonadaceae bacterium PH5-43]
MKTTDKKHRSLIQYVFSGIFLTEDGLVKQSKLIILVVILFLLFISNDYSCRKKLYKIEELKVELNDVKYHNLVISTQLTYNSRQSQLEKLLEEKGINLSGNKNPAYMIKK